MITAHKLGYYGQLGNQMFQYAMLLGVSEKTGYEVIIPDNRIVKHCGFENKPLYYALWLYDCFEIPEKIGPITRIQNIFQEKQHHFDPNVFNIPDNTSFIGQYESEKYFAHAADRVKKSFVFRSEIKTKAERRFKEITRPGKKNVALHVRQIRKNASFIQQHHPFTTPEFYWAAISQFPKEDHDIIIFGDDLEWSRETFKSDNIFCPDWVDDPRPDYIDLCMITMCDHHIIANSSFSWWGAWLASNPDQRVFAPSTWFGPALPNKKTHDIIPERWIKI